MLDAGIILWFVLNASMSTGGWRRTHASCWPIVHLYGKLKAVAVTTYKNKCNINLKVCLHFLSLLLKQNDSNTWSHYVTLKLVFFFLFYQTKFGVNERAIYAALSGNLSQVAISFHCFSMYLCFQKLFCDMWPEPWCPQKEIIIFDNK